MSVPANPLLSPVNLGSSQADMCSQAPGWLPDFSLVPTSTTKHFLPQVFTTGWRGTSLALICRTLCTSRSTPGDEKRNVAPLPRKCRFLKERRQGWVEEEGLDLPWEVAELPALSVSPREVPKS